jgi:hypothetical protein
MKVKKQYSIGDTVWIYGIDSRFNVSVKGKVVHTCMIENFADEHYIVAVPTEIEPLLEVRTWHNISQTKDGHVGSIREALQNPAAARKFLARAGIGLTETPDNDGEQEPDQD